MGKDGDLWDDSALINAFDHAISKYKMMHGRGPHDNTKEEENALGNTEERLSTLGDGSYEAKRHAQADDNSNVASNTTTELGETYDLPGSEKDHIVDSFAQECNVDLSSGQHTQDALQDYSNTQGAGDYTQLLNQYYVLEEQRQKILQQLQQFGSWDYQGSSGQWGTCSASQEYKLPTNQTSFPAVVSSCCPYACQCLVAPCSFGGTCVGKTCDATSGIGHNGKSPSFEDGDIIKTAMEAAERAISSLKTKTSEKGEESHEGQLEQRAICETDLTVVFNAWYSAGFHTGKYLAEQSIAKKRHG
ncbi:uncharacterized protein LOC130756890 isoform X1 [Actinidia eriantha]|uniref:uncharacterized protein LOC130756890 isoform X1 n=2 Tax=Actinidia eriantha TaxID=165200 RepID=UPI00258BEFCA|nr:uncharacterized protein LOC130756890 isoform X1 [Actinidia eriantha]